MKLVEVKYKCSFAVTGNCEEVGTEEDELVSPLELTVDGLTREIDVCKNHREFLVENLLKPLMADGRIVEKPKVKKRKSPSTSSKSTVDDLLAEVSSGDSDDDLTCKFPDCDKTEPLKTTRGLAQHVTRAHGYANLAGYLEDYPPSG